MDIPHESHHPSDKKYIKVALFLAVVTAIEIAISYLGLDHWLMIGLLLLLALVKFVGVVAYFMHLKFDNPILRKPFIVGMLLAVAVYTIVLLAFTLHSTGA